MSSIIVFFEQKNATRRPLAILIFHLHLFRVASSLFCSTTIMCCPRVVFDFVLFFVFVGTFCE